MYDRPNLKDVTYDKRSDGLLLMNVLSISNEWHDKVDKVSNRGASVITLTETCCISDTVCCYNMPGFVAFHSYQCSKRSGGLALYFKKDYKPCLIVRSV